MERKDSDHMNEAEIEIKRRGVLRAFGAGAGLSALSKAKGKRYTQQQVQDTISELTSPEAVRRSIQEQASDIMLALAERDLLETGSLADFPSEVLLDEQEYLEAEEAIHVNAIEKNGELTPHIILTRQTNNHEIKIFVQPELNRAYSFIETHEGESFMLKADPESNDGVGTYNCYRDGCYCDVTDCSGCCAYNRKWARMWCDTCQCYEQGDYLGCCSTTDERYNCH